MVPGRTRSDALSNELHDVFDDRICLNGLSNLGDCYGFWQHVGNDEHMILQILIALALCFGAGLVWERVSREKIGRIVFVTANSFAYLFKLLE